MNKLRVLLIDDEEELVATMKERLELRGIEADAVTTGDRGLELIARKSYDVVVVDLKMPGLGGTEVVDLIKQRQPEIDVLLITGHGSGHGELDELVNRGYRILLKPFKIDRLLSMITESAGDKGTHS
jgi:DNA-binding NtrC family response regulator